MRIDACIFDVLEAAYARRPHRDCPALAAALESNLVARTATGIELTKDGRDVYDFLQYLRAKGALTRVARSDA